MEGTNELVTLTAKVAQWAYFREVTFSTENPRSSWPWRLDRIVELFGSPGVKDATLQLCMVGGKRDKRSTWRTSSEALFTALDGRKRPAGGVSGTLTCSDQSLRMRPQLLC